jgi:hypothetical protein
MKAYYYLATALETVCGNDSCEIVRRQSNARVFRELNRVGAWSVLAKVPEPCLSRGLRQ